MRKSCTMVTTAATIFLAIVSSSCAYEYQVTNSTKRGVVISYDNYRCDDLKTLTYITSWYSRGMKLPTAVDGPCSELPVQEHISMKLGKSGTNKVGNWIPDGTNILMGFLDPNSELGANITGKKAAKKWKEMEASLDAAGRSDVLLLTPSASVCGDECMPIDSGNPWEWYDEFFDSCNASALNCRIDGLASHYWDCNPAMILGHVNHLYARYQQKIWMTLYPCPLAKTANETMEFMKHMIYELEMPVGNGVHVEKYYWDASRMPEGGSKINQLFEDDSSELTPVGQFWNSHMPVYNLA